MSEPRPPERDDTQVVIAVVRTGGIAGLRRRWRVEAPSDEASDWIALIDSCPWDAPAPDGRGADRFVWSIRARTPSERREQELPDAALDGPWRELVDAVRAASAEGSR
ncbi:protealysin inhibitor emfourin [Microbacterium sp.]|uniref:protealysin inhibitor emfourin n=1 Tax=Microbacterium sp. TaxID=51671 RepID=UPI0039E71522